MNPQEQLQRFLVYVLRHNPDELGLSLNKDGFVKIAEILQQLQKSEKYRDVNEQAIRNAVAAQPNKQRLQIEGDLLRACYGHSSTAVDEIEYLPVNPPQYLFHGTAIRHLISIRQSGLLPVTRKFVHMTDSREQAQSVALRHSKEIVILTILCDEAKSAGLSFYNPEPNIWLAQQIPPQYIKFPAQ